MAIETLNGNFRTDALRLTKVFQLSLSWLILVFFFDYIDWLLIHSGLHVWLSSVISSGFLGTTIWDVIVGFLITGFLTGVAQFLVLNRVLAIAYRWLVATVFGYTIAHVASLMLMLPVADITFRIQIRFDFVDNRMSALFDGLLLGTATTLMISFFQWMSIRRAVSKAYGWVPISVASTAIYIVLTAYSSELLGFLLGAAVSGFGLFIIIRKHLERSPISA